MRTHHSGYSSKDEPTIVLFSLGGTISIPANDEHVEPTSLTAPQLLESVPGATTDRMHVKTRSALNVPSSHLTYSDIVSLMSDVAHELDNGARGVVITQGTDTLEETAFLADLLHEGPGAVVMTGAMRQPGTPGADGPANVAAALLTAASPWAEGKGVLVVFDDQIHSARAVRKTHSTRTSAFKSTGPGPVGVIIENRVKGSTLDRLRPPFAVARDLPVDPHRVGFHVVTLDDNGELLESAHTGFDGLVVAATGAGHVSPTTADAMESLARQMPVVLTTRTGAGPILTSTYHYAGSESDLLKRGLINAGDLHPYKAKVLLRLALAAGASTTEIKEAFRIYGNAP
jgi:L-asparaginase